MQHIQPPPPPKPRQDMIVGGCDFIDLQAAFVRVNRERAETILARWHYEPDLTPEERVRILNRYDPA